MITFHYFGLPAPQENFLWLRAPQLKEINAPASEMMGAQASTTPSGSLFCLSHRGGSIWVKFVEIWKPG